MKEQDRTAPAAASGTAGWSLTETSAEHDMVDTPADQRRWPSVVKLLEPCEAAVGSAFREADLAALQHQKTHRLLAKLAAGFGTIAVLFAIVNMAFPGLVVGPLLVVVEFIAVGAAATAVVLGLLSSRLPNWLIERYKAERLRLAKFRFIIDPMIWIADQPTRQRHAERLYTDVQQIRTLKAKDLLRELEKENPPEPPPEAAVAQTVSPQGLDELVDYYRVKRLLFQRDFFLRCIADNERLDLLTRYLPPILFFGSVLAVLAHFAYDLLPIEKKSEDLSRFCIFLAAALPTLAGGVRTLRTAYEFARNSSRYRAKVVALNRLDDILRDETNSWSKLRELWFCEEILDFEVRECCRLMIESEWFG
jgi:hypothetical protein